jgi:DNA polymerase-3 subunit alpha
MPAVGICDRANLFGALEFSQETKTRGVQPIVGCALPVSGVGGARPESWARKPTVVLLAQSEVGWRNLAVLSSKAFLDSEDEPCVRWSSSWSTPRD